MSDALWLMYARVGFAGKSPYAPGTCGSLVAILLAPFIFMPLPLGMRILLLIALYVTGKIACDKAEEVLRKKDPQEVVIDEVLGQWITCLPFAALGFWGYLAAFILFRIFDIAKPYPISALEKIRGGTGIMLDDAAAGVYAMICLGILRWIF